MIWRLFTRVSEEAGLLERLSDPPVQASEFGFCQHVLTIAGKHKIELDHAVLSQWAGT